MKLTWIILVSISCARASTILPNGSPLVVASYSEPILNYSGSTGNNNFSSSSTSTPLFYGWFFQERVAESISIIGKKYFLSAYDKIPEFQQYVKQLMVKNNVTNPLEFYKKPLDPDSGLPDLKYHTTAKFCGRNDESETHNSVEHSKNEDTECGQYLEQVGQYLGRPYKMHLVGLFFTNFTYGIRVKLTAEEQRLFREDTRENSAQQSEDLRNNEIDRIVHENDDDDNNQRHLSYEPYYHRQQRNEMMDGDNGHYYPGIMFRPQDKNFHPTESRAHITLGCAPDISAVQTGLDLLNIVDLEVSSFAKHVDYGVGGNDIPKGVLREIKVASGDMGQYYTATAFVVYPEEEMIADAIFDAYL